jgi:hypothetical protein
LLPVYCSSPPWRCCRVRDLQAKLMKLARYIDENIFKTNPEAGRSVSLLHNSLPI